MKTRRLIYEVLDRFLDMAIDQCDDNVALSSLLVGCRTLIHALNMLEGELK